MEDTSLDIGLTSSEMVELIYSENILIGKGRDGNYSLRNIFLL